MDKTTSPRNGIRWTTVVRWGLWAAFFGVGTGYFLASRLL